MSSNHENFLNELRSAHLDGGAVPQAPSMAVLRARAAVQRRRQMSSIVAGVAAFVLPFVGAVALLSINGGNDEAMQLADGDIALDTKGTAGAAGGQSVNAGAVAAGPLPMSATEVVAVDQAFRAPRDGFSFANWGGAPQPGLDLIDATTMAALFTKESVCVDPAAGTCVLLPAAQKIADQMNAAIANGRCEGMSVLSQRFFDNLDPRAEGLFETVKISQGSVAKQIGYWWATQVAPQVAKESKRYKAMTPSQVVAELEKGLATKAGFTLGMYSAQGGHSVTPVAVTNDGSKKIIYVYDNNYPNENRKVVVDTATQTWTYVGAGLNSSSAVGSWTGTGPGTLDLTPMAVRQGPFKVSFGATRGLKSQAYQVMVTQKNVAGQPVKPVGVQIKARINGKAVDVNTTDFNQVNNAPFPVRNLVGSLAGNGVIAFVPVVIGDANRLTLSVVGDTTAPVTVSVLRTGTASIVVESPSNFSIGITTEAFKTNIDLALPNKSDTALVQLANGPRAVEMKLTDGQRASIETKFTDDDATPNLGSRRIENPLPAFTVKNYDGKVLYRGSLADRTGEGKCATDNLEFDAATGTFKSSEGSCESQSLDLKFIAELRPSEVKFDEPSQDQPRAEQLPAQPRPQTPTPPVVAPPNDDDELDLDDFLGSAPPTSTPTTTIPPSTDPAPTPSTPPTPETFTAPVLTGTPSVSGSFVQGYTWTNAKSVSPANVSGVAGQATGSFRWTLTATRAEDAKSGYVASGSVTISNNGTVDVTDVKLTVASQEFECDLIAAGGSEECSFTLDTDALSLSYSATGSYTVPANFQDAGQTKTVSLDGGTMTVSYEGSTVGATASLADADLAGFTTQILTGATSPYSFTSNPVTAACPSIIMAPAPYALDPATGEYVNEFSVWNTSTLTPEGGSAADASESVRVRCTWTPPATRDPDSSQPNTPTNNNPPSWGVGCTKIDSASGMTWGMTWTAGADYTGVVLKAGTTDWIFVEVKEGEILKVGGTNGISHIIYCTGTFDSDGATELITSTFTVTYAKGATGNVTNMPSSQSCVAEGTQPCTVTLSATVPQRTGYSFTGWSDGSTLYQPGADVTLTSNLSLTAQWDAVVVPNPVYTIRWISNGQNVYATNSCTSGSAFTEPVGTPTWGQRTFVKWDIPTGTCTADTDIYAIWNS